MPYFKSLNTLYLHVPKTGGMSIEEYFYSKCEGLEKNEKSIYGWYFDRPNRLRVPQERSLQHFTFPEILENKDFFDFETNSDMQIIMSVRNPFDRMISELFWNQRINIDSSPEEVANQIHNYLYVDKEIRDNHKSPQYLFFEGLRGVRIVKTESLIEDMRILGYTDFDIRTNTCRSGADIDYKKYLNHRSIQMIVEYYAKDFEMFGYDKYTNFNATIVTAFIGNINRNKSRSIDEYIDFGNRLLKIPNPKVVFVDHDSFRTYFAENVTLYPFTTFIPMAKEDIYLHHYRDQLTKFYVNGNPDKDTIDYIFVQCNKTEWVVKAIDLNMYKTSQYIWIDFGIYHMIKNPELFERLILGMTEKTYSDVRIASCKYNGYSVPYNVYEILTWTFAGSVFGGSVDALLEFAFLTKKEILKTIREKKSIMWEINIWYLVYRQYLEFFNFYTCGHDFRILEYY